MIEPLNLVLNATAAASGGSPALEPQAAAAIAVGLSAIATGYAQRGIGSAAVGAVAEDSDNLVSGLIFTAIPETLIIIAFVTIFIVG
jgi:V/A-type H+-transporting ATPase subunit K